MKNILNYKDYINENLSNRVSKILIELRDKYMKEENITAKQINSGLCEDVQYEFFEIFGDETPDTFMMDDGWFWNMDIKSKYKTASGEYWDVDNLIQYAEPPFDWKILRKFDLEGHSWIYHEGKHYDVEAINGVENMWDLPIYKRQVEEVMKKNKKSKS